MTVVMRNNRKRPRGELRTLIYETAISLFREKGFGGTTVDDVVAAAGVAKGTFFNFFPSKLDVLKTYYAVIDVAVTQCREAMDPSCPEQALCAYAAAVEGILLREGPLMFELLDIAATDPGLRRLDAESGAADAEGFATFLLCSQSKGLIAGNADVARTSRALIDLWSGAVRDWLVLPAPGGLQNAFEWRVRLLFSGLAHRS